MGMWQQFLMTVPKLIIGQQVRVKGEYEGDWPMVCIVTGIVFDAVRGRWNIHIMPKDEIEDQCGGTDGFTEDDLYLAHEEPTDGE